LAWAAAVQEVPDGEREAAELVDEEEDYYVEDAAFGVESSHSMVWCRGDTTIRLLCPLNSIGMKK
jgi:hypothetical protein